MALTTDGNGKITGFTTTPLYMQVEEAIAARIADGVYTHAVPNEHVLAAEMGVSSGTMRKALNALEGRGLVERKQGRGTYVCERRAVESLPRPARILLDALPSFDAATRDAVSKAVTARLHQIASGRRAP